VRPHGLPADGVTLGSKAPSLETEIEVAVDLEAEIEVDFEREPE